MKNVLVTGSMGYIGQHLIKMMEGKYNVDGVDMKDPFNSIDLAASFNITKRYDAVVHLAAYCNVSKSTKCPERYYKNNILSTINALHNITTNNFIFASTGSAAGMASPYAISKKACEEIVTNYCEVYKKEYTIFRFYNVTGSDGFAPTNPDGLFASLMRAENTGKFYVCGTDYDTPDGSAIRDYTHVNEICAAIMKAIETPANGIENLGHSVGTSVKDMAKMYQKVNNCSFEIIDAPRRPGDLEVSVVPTVSEYMVNMYALEDLLKRDEQMLKEIQ